MRDNIQWTHRNENHGVAWYTDKDYKVSYKYDSHNAHQPIEFPPWMLFLRDHMMKVLNLPKDDPPHGCNVNLYKSGY